MFVKFFNNRIIRPRLLQKLHPSMTKIIAINYSDVHRSKIGEVQDKWRKRDGVGQQWQLIYKAPMDRFFNFATTYLTVTTASVSCFTLYYALSTDLSKPHDPVIIGDDVVIANSTTEALTYLGAFILFNALLKSVLSQYVIRLYQDGDNYLAIYRGHMFNSIQKEEFHLKDFRKLGSSNLIPWVQSRYSIGARKAIFLEDYFKSPDYLYYLINKTTDRVYANKSSS